MCWTGLSVGFYNRLIETHFKLSSIRAYGDKDIERLESDFYDAVTARNLYHVDDCRDLILMLE